mgnify:CR=1 FL=1
MTSSYQPWWISSPVAELAVSVLPMFGHSSFDSERGAMTDVVAWLRTGARDPRGVFSAGVSSRGDVFQNPDLRAVAEAMQLLERSGLLLRVLVPSSHSSFDVGLTRLGWHAVQTGTIRQHLGLEDR